MLAGWWAPALAARVGGAGGDAVTVVDKPLERQSPPPASRGRGLGAGAGAELRTWRSRRASGRKSNGWARRLCSLTLAYLECISAQSPWLVNNPEEGNARGIPADVCRISQLK